MDEKKTYLGDSVYCRFDGFGFTLTTENGYGPTNEIYFEPEVLESFIRFRDRIYDALPKDKEP